MRLSENQKRVGMTVSGIFISGVSVGIFNLASFGVDPFQSFAQGLWRLFPIGYGLFYAILNSVMLVLVFIFDRKKIGLGTVINIFLLGYVVEGTTFLFTRVFGEINMPGRVACLVIGILVLCFGSSLYFVADMGVSTYDAVALYLSEHKVARFAVCRIATDAVCVLIGFLCGAKVGVATLLTAFFMGPVIQIFNSKVSYPLRYGKEWRDRV